MSALAKTQLKLVEVHGKKLTTTSLIIANEFGRRHDNVLQTIKKLLDDGTISLLDSKERFYKKLGRQYPYYELNERSFLIAMPFIGGKKSRQGQVKLVDEFLRQRQIISSLIQQRNDPFWQRVRIDGKSVYHEKTDVIKRFIEYAKNQGSKSADKYYISMAKMENKALFSFNEKFSNVREALNTKQLMQVSTADDVIERALIDGMEKGIPYREIFRLAKKRVIDYANIIGRTPVLCLQHGEVSS